MNNFQKILRTWCIFAFLLLVFMAGCASVNIASLLSNPTNTNTPPDYNRWLRKQPCAPPCWEGITPGITHYKDALAQLKQNQWFEKVEFHLPDSITWNWRGIIGGGRLEFDAWATSPVIQSIVIGSPQKISFKDVVAALGNPDYVTVTADTGEHEDGIWYGPLLYLVWCISCYYSRV